MLRQVIQWLNSLIIGFESSQTHFPLRKLVVWAENQQGSSGRMMMVMDIARLERAIFHNTCQELSENSTIKTLCF